MNEQEIAVRITDIDARCKSNTHRLDDVERRQDALDSMTASMARMAERQDHMDSDVKEIKSDVKTLTERPVKKWDGVVDKVLAALVGAFVAWILSGGV